MYQASLVACGSSCVNENQSCLSNGSWSGTYAYGTCAVGSCVATPGALSGGTISLTPTPGRPQVSGSLSNSADGFYLVRCDANDANCYLAATGSGTTFAFTSLTCPMTYNLYFYAYNNDTSLAGASDSSCNTTIKTKLPSLDVSNKRCSTPVGKSAKIDYCTQGFFNN
jgi:expansin (peptidoglycan-binding protein)